MTSKTTSTSSPWPAGRCRSAGCSSRRTYTMALLSEPSTSSLPRSQQMRWSEGTMNRCKWMMRAVLSGLTWAWLGVGVAQAGVIPPTDPTTFKLIANPTVTVSLYQLDSLLPSTVTLSSPSRCTTTGTSFYKDVTDCWLPEWVPGIGGKSVFVVVKGPTTDLPTLVLPPASATFPLASGAANPFVAGLTTSA